MSTREEFLQTLNELCNKYLSESDDFIALSLVFQSKEIEPVVSDEEISELTHEYSWTPETCRWEPTSVSY